MKMKYEMNPCQLIILDLGSANIREKSCGEINYREISGIVI